MYNEGTARYAEALSASETTPDSPPSSATSEPVDPMQEAMDAVSQSLQHFKDAITADPANADARANAELAHRLLKQLEEIQQ